jgi:hypothetical protein
MIADAESASSAVFTVVVLADATGARSFLIRMTGTFRHIDSVYGKISFNYFGSVDLESRLSPYQNRWVRI